MAVALKQRSFNNASEVSAFAANVANSVTTIISIVYDTASSKYVLFYT